MGGWSDEIRDDSLFCGSRVALRSAKQIVVVRLVPRDLPNLIRLSPRFSGWLRPSARAPTMPFLRIFCGCAAFDLTSGTTVGGLNSGQFLCPRWICVGPSVHRGETRDVE